MASAYGQNDFSLRAKLQGKDNDYTNSTGYELISSNVTERNKICPTGECNFEISNGKLEDNTYNAEQMTLDGTLRSITQNNNVKITKLYPFRSDLSITEIREIDGMVVNLLVAETVKLSESIKSFSISPINLFSSFFSHSFECY